MSQGVGRAPFGTPSGREGKGILFPGRKRLSKSKGDLRPAGSASSTEPAGGAWCRLALASLGRCDLANGGEVSFDLRASTEACLDGELSLIGHAKDRSLETLTRVPAYDDDAPFTAAALPDVLDRLPDLNVAEIDRLDQVGDANDVGTFGELRRIRPENIVIEQLDARLVAQSRRDQQIGPLMICRPQEPPGREAKRLAPDHPSGEVVASSKECPDAASEYLDLQQMTVLFGDRKSVV